MKRRYWEVLGIVGLVAVVMLSLQHRETTESVPLTSWSVAAPPDLLTSRSDYENEPARNFLNPNLHRDPALFNSHDISVSGVKLGMSFVEVTHVLGEPKEITGRPPLSFSAEFPPEGPGPDRPRASFVDDKLVSIEGSVLPIGKRICESGQPATKLFELLGKNDYLHHSGMGGNPTYCWAAKDVVLEVDVFENAECEEIVSQFHLGDPKFFAHSPHLWLRACGGVEEELQAPRPAKLDD